VAADAGRHGRRRFLKLAAFAAPATVLAACEGVLPGQGPPPRLFVLTPKSTFPESLPTVDWQLIIEVPVAATGLDTTRISLQRSPVEHEYYARANWTDRTPTLVQTLLVESFENSRKIVAVGRESLGLRADFVLKSELREFQAEFDRSAPGTPPAANVKLGLKLVQMPERAIVGSRNFEHRIPASTDTLEAIVDAFDVALGKVLKDVVSWTLITGDRHAAQDPLRRRS
jgi:cholesterol transport system auxiliary component